MSARILDGAAVALQIRQELAARASAFAARSGRKASLSIVLVGDKADSQIYVNSKIKSFQLNAMAEWKEELPCYMSFDWE